MIRKKAYYMIPLQNNIILAPFMYLILLNFDKIFIILQKYPL